MAGILLKDSGTCLSIRATIKPCFIVFSLISLSLVIWGDARKKARKSVGQQCNQESEKATANKKNQN